MLRRLVFAHDNRFLLASDGQIYSRRGPWSWDRYLGFAEELRVVARMEALPTASDTSDLELASRPGVSFVAVPSLSGPLLQFTNRRAADRILKTEIADADAVVARLPSEIGNRAAAIAERLGKRWAAEVVTCTWDALWNYGSWQGKAYAPLSWWKTRRLVRRAPYAIYVTDEFLQRRYPAGGRSVGVSDVELPPLDDAVLAARLERIRSRPSPFRLGVIAALTVRFKGVQTALEALGSLRDMLPPFELRILGAGDPAPWRDLAATHEVADRVHFDGALPAGEPVLRWLDEVDLYLQPSFQEGLPRSLVEALSRACPALGSTAGGIPELLAPECLHRPGDATALAQLIATAVRDEAWQSRQAARNFETAKRYEAPRLDAVRASFWDSFAAA